MKARPKKNNLLVSFDSTLQRKSPELRTSQEFNSHCASRDAVSRNGIIEVGNSAKEVKFNDDMGNNDQSTTLVGWNKDDQFSNNPSRQTNYNNEKKSNRRANTITISVNDEERQQHKQKKSEQLMSGMKKVIVHSQKSKDRILIEQREHIKKTDAKLKQSNQTGSYLPGIYQ
jgi:hypothetical protein